jgi:hypothetical protein
VTIVAGFKCYEGIVLCADTQETVGSSKRNVPKLRFEPADRVTTGVGRNDLAVAFCGATDNGAFMDELIDRAWEDAQTATSLEEICSEIKKSIKASYADAVKLYHPSDMPRTELIYGAKMGGQSRLFYAYGPAVNEKQQYAIGGVGAYIADFLASRIYKDNLNVRQCTILAAYILSQAGEHVDGCGGESHIAVLREEATSGRVDWHRVEVLTDLLKMADDSLGAVLLNAADLEGTDADFRQHVADTVEILEMIREAKKGEITSREAFFGALVRNTGTGTTTHDEFGLPMLSDAQTTEDEQ